MEFCWRVESTTGRVMEDSEWHHHCGGECTGEENGSISPRRRRVRAADLLRYRAKFLTVAWRSVLTITLREALASDQLDAFVQQEEAFGVELAQRFRL